MTPLARVVLALAETLALSVQALWLAGRVALDSIRLAVEARRWQGRYPDRTETIRMDRPHAHSGHGRRVHRCRSCGGVAPPDAIRLKGGIRYCPTGDCRKEADRLMAEARATVARQSQPSPVRKGGGQ